MELSNTVTHKLDLCIECDCPLPKDHPAVLNKPEFLEQLPDEDVTVSDARKRAYINAAMHQNCRKKPPPKRGASSSNAIDTFKAGSGSEKVREGLEENRAWVVHT